MNLMNEGNTVNDKRVRSLNYGNRLLTLWNYKIICLIRCL